LFWALAGGRKWLKLHLAQSACLYLNRVMSQSILQDKYPISNSSTPALVTFTIAGAITLPFAPMHRTLSGTSNPAIAVVIYDRMVV
jgi:hypothetical protein